MKHNIDKINKEFENVDEPKFNVSDESILKSLESKILQVNFRKEVDKYHKEAKITQKHYAVIAIDKIKEIAEKHNCGLCIKNDFIYVYNSSSWRLVERDDFQNFLGNAGERMGIPKFDAKHYSFKEKLFKQFLSDAYLPSPSQDLSKVLINLKNGTFEVSSKGNQLRPFDRQDFLTYQLPFEYDKDATAPQFQKFLKRVLPDQASQDVLAEYLGFLFLKNGGESIKEEKALILYGGGANGKSVIFHIVSALLGNENVSTYSLQSLTDEKGYQRANLSNVLVNYASEINGKMDVSYFKQLVSGEPVEARLPYGNPFILRQYAKFIFNCNELPQDVEQTNGFFRRFLIIPFNETIPPKEQDKELHTKIIKTELPGILNWVLTGLERLLAQKGFTNCQASDLAVDRYKIESDSVAMFMNENSYVPSINSYVSLKDLYTQYKIFTSEDGYRSVSKRTFKARLINLGYDVDRKSQGIVVFAEKVNSIPFM